jgi:ATP-dependent DNA helicase DinG
MAMTTDYIDEAIEATGGHAFVLFTSFRALNYTYNRLEEGLRTKGITPLKQGGQNRTHLLERFRRDSRSCLFATDSFWEGVDVAGDALQCVILPRLPFRVPTEPILQARAEAIEARGGNAFMDYTVPLAVIKFRQGFGRLVRRRTDRGSILVLDSRILTKYYGKLFLESLPEIRVVKGGRNEVFTAFRKFHADEEEE